jgi:hypothetical protein
MVSDAERTAVQEMARLYLVAMDELSTGKEWKNETDLKDAASTIVISYYKEVRPKLNYHTGSNVTKTEPEFKTADKIAEKPVENKDIKGYVNGAWVTCKCGAYVMTGTNKKTNEPFHYCEVCKIYLNKDGSTFPIPQRK